MIEWLPDDPYPRALLLDWPDEPGDVAAADVRALEDDAWALLEEFDQMLERLVGKPKYRPLAMPA